MRGGGGLFESVAMGREWGGEQYRDDRRQNHTEQANEEAGPPGRWCMRMRIRGRHGPEYRGPAGTGGGATSYVEVTGAIPEPTHASGELDHFACRVILTGQSCVPTDVCLLGS